MAFQDICEAAQLIHEAMDAAGTCYSEYETGIVDTTSTLLAAALLSAGWTPPPVGRREQTRREAIRHRED